MESFASFNAAFSQTIGNDSPNSYFGSLILTSYFEGFGLETSSSSLTVTEDNDSVSIEYNNSEIGFGSLFIEAEETANSISLDANFEFDGVDGSQFSGFLNIDGNYDEQSDTANFGADYELNEDGDLSSGDYTLNATVENDVVTGFIDIVEFEDGQSFSDRESFSIPIPEVLVTTENTNPGNTDRPNNTSPPNNTSTRENTIYRFFNISAGVHFYTASEVERDAVLELDNFSFEGGSYVGADPLTGQPQSSPVYRFLNQDTGVHLYTISEIERDFVLELNNFSFEGEAFFAYESPVAGSIPIYRFFNLTTGAHFYTPSAGERDAVANNLPDFASEGIAYYALPLSE